MSYADEILPEFDQEMANTRRVLERVPENQWDFRAHPQSNTIGWNANHLAEILGWVEGILTETAWDFAPSDGPRYESPSFKTRKDVLELFDQNVAAARRAIQNVNDENLRENWSLLAGGQTIFTMPRAAVMRRFVLNHIIHHRATLCVYLRLNDIPVPGMYHPSGDDLGG